MMDFGRVSDSSDSTNTLFESGLKEFLKSQNGSQIVLPKSLFDSINPVTVSLNVDGCNFLNYCSQPMPTQITIDAVEETLKIDVYGLEPPVRSSQKLNMYAVTSLKYCNSVELLKEGVKVRKQNSHSSWKNASLFVAFSVFMGNYS